MRLALFGAAPDTPNMGVSALFLSAVGGIAAHIDDAEFVVFDNGLGRRDETLRLPDGRPIHLIRFGARGGRRYHRPENLATMQLASSAGFIGGMVNEGIRLIDSCAAVLDVSGGDSFSDIYGRSRFYNIFRPKAIAVSRRKPLILLPQTYGPYAHPALRELAATVTQQAGMAWARDARSFANLKELVADRFDPSVHRCGVDMAFGLASASAEQQLDARLNEWLAAKRSGSGQPLIGFNVSGLIYNDPQAAKGHYGFKADYGQAVVGCLHKILQQGDARVVLIPHVMDQLGHYESDLAACRDVERQLAADFGERIAIAPATLGASEVKWLIAQMDWFCGTRMHSTIAGLSSGVPTAAISYSDKTLGVFESCGQGGQVMDPRRLPTSGIIDGLWLSFLNRDGTREALAASLPAVRQAAIDQLRVVVERVQRAAN